jgi:hypothetical protein
MKGERGAQVSLGKSGSLMETCDFNYVHSGPSHLSSLETCDLKRQNMTTKW